MARMSMPLLAQTASPSSETQVVVNAHRLLTSLPTLPAPRGPRWKVARPIVASSGAQRSKTGASPPPMKTSMRALAPGAAAGGGPSGGVPPAGREPLADPPHGLGCVGGEIEQDRVGRG